MPRVNRPSDDDDIDQRFQALMRANFEPHDAERRFGTKDSTAHRLRPEPARPSKSRRNQSRASEPEHDDFHPQSLLESAPDYRTPRSEAWRHTRWATLGMVLMVVGLVGGLAGVFGVRFPSPLPQLFSVASIVGLVLLLWQALRARRPDDQQHGTL